MSNDIEILVDDEFREEVGKGCVKKIVRQVLKAEGVAPPYEVSLVVTDSATVRHLNRGYRGVDEYTDVLAFSMLSRKGDEPSFTLPPDGVTRLGEVIVSYPQALVQAKEQGHPPEREMALLVIHGLLHLLGYDHELPEEERKMRDREEQLLQKYSAEQ
jgi:probable rRNA maturation factor